MQEWQGWTLGRSNTAIIPHTTQQLKLKSAALFSNPSD